MKIYILFLTALFYLLTPFRCDAEKIYCKDGRVVQAKIVSRSGNSVWYEQEFAGKAGSVGIDLADIDRIENNDGSISKHDYKSLYEKSRDCLRGKDYKEAVRLYGLLLESFPESIKIRRLRALLNHKIGNLERAIEDYEFCIKRGAGDVKVFNNLGAIYAKRKEYQEAVNYFSKAIEEEPDLLEAHSNLAEIFMLTKDYHRAIDEYRRVLESKPDNAEVLYNLGIAYMNERDYSKARERWKKLLAIRPGDKDAKKALEYIDLIETAPEKK